jgi:hypothetical protein
MLILSLGVSILICARGTSTVAIALDVGQEVEDQGTASAYCNVPKMPKARQPGQKQIGSWSPIAVWTSIPPIWE